MNQDATLQLLSQCEQGIKMGVSSIDDVMNKAHSPQLREKLSEFKSEHETLREETENELIRMGAELKDPPAIAKGMSWIKTNIDLALHDSDRTIANLMTDGCNMGIKNLNAYLNDYSDASEHSRQITGRLIDLERRMTQEMQSYL